MPPGPPGGMGGLGANPMLRMAIGQFLGEQSKVDPNYIPKTLRQTKLNILGMMQHLGLKNPKVEKSLTHALSAISSAIEEHDKWQQDMNRVNQLSFSVARPGFAGQGPQDASPRMGPVPTLPSRTPS